MYANDASLTGNKSIKMYINAVEVASSEGKWDDITPDEHIWLGAQSQTGKNPANGIISDLKILNLPKTEIILPLEQGDKDALFFSKLNSANEILSPQKGVGGQVFPNDYFKNKRLFKSKDGFISSEDGVYILFPALGNISHSRGIIELKLKPLFIASDKEHVFLSTVKWDAEGGANGFYIYYQPEEGS